IGSRGTTREAYSVGLIEDGDIWMEMISSRNLTSHTYNEEIAEEVFIKIKEAFLPCFIKFENTMLRLLKENE
ncbi:MAG TPA: nucleotidyltransferase, partial [Bacteroidetes bacterium]|nr:nucleotidyltransferase [Bacteroidota bacterium]